MNNWIVAFKDYDVWIAFDEVFKSRKEAKEYLTSQSAKYPLTSFCVSTEKEAIKRGIE